MLDDVSADLIKAIYKGHTGRIDVGGYSADMTQLTNAAATFDDLENYELSAKK
jgi:hypothetical protein